MYYDIEEVKKFTENFGLNEDDGLTEDDVDFLIAEIDCSKVPSFDWDNGATKLVIMPENRDYVIKVPFNGAYDNGNFFSFEGAESEYCDNYCEAENRLYQQALTEGFEEMFLPNEYIWTVDSIPIYVQQKVEVLDKEDSEQEKYSSKKSKEKIMEARKEGERFLNLPTSWVASCLDILGSMEEVRRFLKFLRETEISFDLHCSNVGYYNGHAIILDYGGYFENY